MHNQNLVIILPNYQFMLPARKVSKSFRDNRAPTLLPIQNLRTKYHNQNYDGLSYETQQPINHIKCNLYKKLEPIPQIQNKPEKSLTETRLAEFINKESERLKNKKSRRIVIDSKMMNGDYKRQSTINSLNERHKTTQSTDAEFDHSTAGSSVKKNQRRNKTDIATQILSQIQKSMASTQRSSSVIGSHKKKKPLIDECKVIKIPWGLKTGIKTKSKQIIQFNPTESMIQQNASTGPRDSLKQIIQQLK